MEHGVAIVGVGEIPHGRFASRTSLEGALEVSRHAIANARLTPGDVDAVLVAPAFADGEFNIDIGFGRLVEELGMRGRASLAMQVNSGGSTGERMVRIARGLIATGQARFVLCVHTDKFTEMSKDQILSFFATAGFDKDFEAPYGVTYNSIASLAAQRYLHETGAPEEALAHVTASLRAWAALSPNARAFGKPLSVEEIMASPVIQWPLRAAMIPAPADGGSAFVVAGARDAAALRERPAYVVGEASRVNTFSFTQHDDFTKMGWAAVGRSAFDEAGLKPGDIGIAAIYMAYPIFHLLLLEELGFCGPGGAGEFVASGATLPGGALPLATNGEAIGNGHTGAGVGLAVLVDVARQLMGEAGDKQVDADFVLEASAGGSYMDANVMIFGREPR